MYSLHPGLQIVQDTVDLVDNWNFYTSYPFQAVPNKNSTLFFSQNVDGLKDWYMILES